MVRVHPTGREATTGVERTTLYLVPDEGTTALAVAKSLVGSSTAIPAWYRGRKPDLREALLDQRKRGIDAMTDSVS